MPFIKNETAEEFYMHYGLPPTFSHVVQSICKDEA